MTEKHHGLHHDKTKSDRLVSILERCYYMASNLERAIPPLIALGYGASKREVVVDAIERKIKAVDELRAELERAKQRASAKFRPGRRTWKNVEARENTSPIGAEE